MAVAAAYAYERANAAAPGKAGYGVAVTDGSRVLETFDVAQLRALGVRRVMMQGKPETGPTLLSVLGKAGVTQFESVTVIGLGARDSGKLVLDRSAVDQDVLLDVANRGTAKVCGPNIPYDERVRDVVRIEVQR